MIESIFIGAVIYFLIGTYFVEGALDRNYSGLASICIGLFWFTIPVSWLYVKIADAIHISREHHKYMALRAMERETDEERRR